MFSHAISVVETLPEGMKVHKNNYQEHTSQLHFAHRVVPNWDSQCSNGTRLDNILFVQANLVWEGRGSATYLATLS